jgi:hypothetical protein
MVAAVAPVAVPAGVLIIARIVGASWPLAMVVACLAIPVVWFATHEQTWTPQS